MLAIVTCATVPFLISLVFIPSVIESKLSMSMHAQVEERLEAAALFYREFFEAKKSEYAARAQSLAMDPPLREALSSSDFDAARARLATLIADNEQIRHIVARDPSGGPLVEVEGPEDRLGADLKPRTLTAPLGLTEAPLLEVTFVLPARYFADRREAAEIAVVYRTARKLESERARAFYLAYFGILVAAVTVSLAVGLWLSRSVTRRVTRLAAATERVAKGDWNFQVAVSGSDEIARLARGFNRMISEVSAARDRIVYLEKVSGWQDLARRLAHEIKNPLTPIRLAIQELRRRARPEDPKLSKLVSEVSEVVDEEVEALSRLVDEFSQFARLPAVTPARVDLPRFLEGFVRAYLKYREDASIELSPPPAGTDAPLDRVLMRRVLVNLVDNAIDAADRKVPTTIRLSGAPLEDGGTEIRVEDDGPGISGGLAERIFEPYFTTKDTGTGLGLAIVKKIVLQHGGNIALVSSELGGAAFLIRLPPVPDMLSTIDEDDDDALPPH